MLVSKCCKESVSVEFDCYLCNSCGRICNTLTPWALGVDNEYTYDTSRICSET
jgi:hypothetical protein